MDSEPIRKAVLAASAETAPETDPQRLRPGQPLRRQIDPDSMDWLNVLAAVGERVGFAIPHADAGRFATLDELVARSGAHAGQRRAAPARPGADLPCAQHHGNGVDITLRPMRADDLPLESDFVDHLSPQTRYERFMVTASELSPARLRCPSDADRVRHVALVAIAGREGQQVIVGVVRYLVASAGTRCEFAVAPGDGRHGTGLADVPMQARIDVARGRGLRTMQGIVRATNTAMLHFAHQLGFRT